MRRAVGGTPATHDLQCAGRIRTRRLLHAGDPPDPPAELVHAIATEIRQCCGHRPLKCFRLAAGWTVAAAVDSLHQMCREQGLGARGLVIRSWTGWESGGDPGRDYEDLLCRLFQTGPVPLGFATDYTPPDSGGNKEAAPGNPAPPGSSHAEPGSAVAAVPPGMWQPALGVGTLPAQANSGPGSRVAESGEGAGPTDRRDTLKLVGLGALAPGPLLEDVLGQATAEAMEFTRRVEASAVGAGTLEHLEAVVAEISRSYAYAAPARLFGVARWYRHRVAQLIDGPHTLREGRELYCYAGWLSELLAWLSHDLGDAVAGQAFATDAWRHGWQAGHGELCAWSADAKASIAMYSGQPDRALQAAAHGRSQVPGGHPLAVRLAAQQARAHARLGDAEGFQAGLAEAVRLHERLPARPPSRYGEDAGQLATYAVTSYAASSCIWLGQAEQARRYAEEALRRYATAPAQSRSPSREAIARLDLALALVELGSPEEAGHLGRQALSGERLVDSVLSRAVDLDRALHHRYPKLGVTRDFHQRRAAASVQPQVGR